MNKTNLIMDLPNIKFYKIIFTRTVSALYDPQLIKQEKLNLLDKLELNLVKIKKFIQN